MVKNKSARKYLREVRGLIPGAGNQRKSILQRVRESVKELIEINPDADYDLISERLGSPKQIAVSALEEMDEGKLLRALHIKKQIVGIAAAVALAIVLLWAGVVFSAWVRFNVDMNGSSVVEIIEGEDISTK